MYSFKTSSGGGYLANFQRNRILPIFVINAFLVLVYCLEKIFLDFDLNVKDIFLSFFYGGTIVENGWYLLCIMIFYQFFFLAARFSPKNIAFGILVLTLLYIILAFRMPKWYIISSLAFPSGVIFYYYSEKITDLLNRRYSFVMLASTLIFLCCSCSIYFITGDILLSSRYLGLLKLCMELIYGVTFSGLVVIILAQTHKRLNAQFILTNTLSKISLEIYVMQGFAFCLLRNPKWHLSNDILFALSSIIITLVLAYTVNPILQKITLYIKK